MSAPSYTYRLSPVAAAVAKRGLYRPAFTLAGWLSVFIMLTLLPFAPMAQEQRLVFEHIGLEQGFPQGQIIGLLQDSYGYIWFGTMSGLIRYDGYNFVQYTHRASDTTSLIHTSAWPVAEDRSGNIWIASRTGLNCWNRKTNNFRRFYYNPADSTTLPGYGVLSAFEDSTGVLWVGTDRGLGWYDGQSFHRVLVSTGDGPPRGRSIYTILQDDDGRILAGTSVGITVTERLKSRSTLLPGGCGEEKGKVAEVWKLFKDKKGDIWAGTSTGLFRKKRSEQLFKPMPLAGTPEQQAVKDIVQDKDGYLWIATLNVNGVFRLDPKTGVSIHFTYSPSNSFGLSSNRVQALLIDRLNNLWIGTTNGLNKVDLNPPRFTFLQVEPGDLRPENLIYKACLDDRGGLWFTTYERKFYYAAHPGAPPLTILLPNNPESLVIPQNLYPGREGTVWMATSQSKLSHYGANNGQPGLIRSVSYDIDSFGGYGNAYLEEDAQDPQYIWLNYKNGLCKRHQPSGTQICFSPGADLPSFVNNHINCGIQGPDGFIYVFVGNAFNGSLARFNKASAHFERIETGLAFPDGKSTTRVRQFAVGPDGVIWMATSSGLGKFVSDTRTFSLLTAADGLMEDDLMGLAVDKAGNVWLKCLHYLTKYDPGQKSFRHFNISKDMREFNTMGACAAPDGRFVFPGVNGFYAFYPDSVKLDTSLPEVVLTDFKVLNRSRNFGTSPELIKDITLGYQDNVIAFEYAALHFKNQQNIRYRYRMVGFDENWTEAGTERKATYTNLNAGHLTFEVMAANADGVWNPAPLAVNLHIKPAPWRTWWAYSIMALLVFGSFRSIYLFSLKIRLEHAESVRLRELDAFKTRLYNNITHEFRTPLTVITGMADQVKEHPEEWFSEGLKMIKRNSGRLLDLVNQMLDLSKLETGRLSLHYQQGAVVNFLKYLVESFHSFAASKGVQIHFLSDLDEIMMDFDAERLQQVISNLLANAVKFTPGGGNVYLRIALDEWHMPAAGFIIDRPPALVIRITDTGIGIPAAHLPYIFDRFYQVDDTQTRNGEGTGIGLALAKELINLMGGDISVKSTPGKGAEFMIRLPVTNRADMRLNEALPVAGTTLSAEQEPLLINVDSSAGKPLVLIAEDNNDVVTYLASCLAGDYHLSIAKDGRECTDLAFENIPDLIISDVMMPNMDGFEVCQMLKSDERTSHIPIVMLTAKAGMESRLAGLGYGADAYLAKPFHKHELLIEIKKLLDLRQKLQHHYRISAGLSEEAAALKDAPKPDEVEDYFVKKVRKIVEAHLDDINFSVEDLSREIHLSHSQMHRKLYALTGCSATKFIRLIRLTQAKELLENPSLTITSIALDTGFNDLGYFGKVFRQTFGVTPSEWRDQRGSH